MTSTSRSSAGIIAGINVLAGLWLLASPVWFQETPRGTINDTVVGAVVAGLALVRAFASPAGRWMGWVNVALGGWTALAPWALAFSTNRALTTSNVVTGAVIAVVGVWSTLIARTDAAGTAARHAHAAR